MPTQLDRIEWKLDQLLSASRQGSSKDEDTVIKGSEILPRLTIKQHAALQMLLNGKSNKEMAERFDVSENTSKVYVRSIAARFRVNTRSQIVVACMSAFKDVDPDTYLAMSGGLPKDWDTHYKKPDKYAKLLVKKG